MDRVQHPNWQLWRPEHLTDALHLVYDDSRALVEGDPLNFEEYRARLNASITADSWVTGQEDAWMKREAERENARRERSSRGDIRHTFTRYRPTGDPGPGVVSKPVTVARGGCTFAWWRERRNASWRNNDGNNVAESITVPKGDLFNVSAYTPGDYQLFFRDPRLRAQYAQWAPFLLTAEDWHVGKQHDHIGDSRYERE